MLFPYTLDTSIHVLLGGVMVSVLAIGPTLCIFKPRRRRYIFKGEKSPVRLYSEGKKSPRPWVVRFYGTFKIPLKYGQRHFVKPNLSFPLQYLLLYYWIIMLIGLPESAGGQIRNSPCRHHSTMILHPHISTGGWTIGQLVASVHRRSLTLIDMIININIFFPPAKCKQL
jgi:hypothetical protein